MAAEIGVLDFERDQAQLVSFLKKIVGKLISKKDCHAVCQSLVKSDPAQTKKSLNNWDRFETLIHAAHSKTNTRQAPSSN